MDRKITTFVSLLLVLAVMVTPAFALNVPGFKHHETGRISAVDQNAKTFTLTTDKGSRQFTFEVKDRAMLTGVRAGEHVKVGYKKQNGRMIADSIVPRDERAASRR